MDEREIEEQPEEKPREPEAETTGEPQASQVDSPRDKSEKTEDVLQAAVTESPDETITQEPAQQAAPVDEAPEPEPSPVEEITSVDEKAIQAAETETPDEVVTPEPDQQGAPVAEAQEEPEPSPVRENVLADEDALPVAQSRSSAERRGGQLAQGEVPPDASAEPAWYVIHCYSGYENKVRHNLEQRIETMGMKDRIFDVVIPTQEEIEVKEGKRRTVERHIFPGYVLVNMSLSEESWYVVRNTPGVTGFVGMGNLPTALRPEEVSQIIKRMEADAPTVKVSFKEGERVRIIDGPFNDFRGTVSEIDVERTKVRVMVSFFGRETPVELDFLQVEKA